jgi:cytochrome c oxidase cbb3-type subunit 3
MSEIVRRPGDLAEPRLEPATAPVPRRKQPKEEVIVHVYDDIREADNILPRWWLYTLYGAIVFGIGYWCVYQVWKSAPGPLAEYRVALAAERKEAARKLKERGLSDETLAGLAKNPEEVAAGKRIFDERCVLCHAEGGVGKIGPNLTDKFWLHGGKPLEILATIRGGVDGKGMPAWGPQLGEDRIETVAVYVLSLKDTNAPGGKEPQGKPEE